MNEEQLRIVIKAELEQFANAMRSAKKQFQDFAGEGRKASKEVDGFLGEINQQSKALTALKQDYINLAAAHGKESKAAKDAAEQIKKLSAEYRDNKLLANDLANMANSFDLSIGGDSEEVEKTNAATEDLQGTLAAIRNMDIAELFLNAFGPEVRERVNAFKEDLGGLKEEFNLAGNYFKQAFGELFNHKRTMSDLGVEGESMGERIKGFGLSIRYGFEQLGSAVKQLGTALKDVATAAVGALSSVAVVAAIVAAEIFVVVAAIKNVLETAKQTADMAAQASKIGLETETYGEWAYVLKQVGVEADKLSDFLKTLTEEQNAVRDGSEDMTKAFEAIGLSSQEVMGSSQEELFAKTVAGLQNLENAAERTSIAYKIFGEDAAELSNILYLSNDEVESLIANYYNLGAAPSENLVQKSKELQGSTTNLSYAWQGLKNTLAEAFIPIVIKVVQWLTVALAYVNAFLQGVFGVDLGIGSMGESAADSMDGFNSGVQEGIKNTEKLKRITMGFDELNVVNDPNKSSSAAGGGAYSGMGINPELPVIEVPDLSKFKEWMAEFGSIIQGFLTWAGILVGVFMIAWGLSTANIGLVIGGVAAIGLGIAIGAAGGENSHWSKLGKFIEDVFESVGQTLADVWNWIVSVWNGAIAFFAGLWSSIKQGTETGWKWIVGVFEGAWTGIKNAFSATTSWFGNIFAAAWNGIKNTWTGATNFFGNIWTGIKNAFGSVGNWFKDTFQKAWAGVKNVFSTGGKIFDGIKEGISGVFTTVVNGLIKGINKVIKVPFDTINGLLNTIRGISVLGVSPFKDLWGKNPLSVPQIPLLAKGGIINSATLAMIGERGKEAVVPLENNTEWMDKLAARLGNNSPSRIVLMVDGRELGYAAINSINGITEQTGELQLVLV